MDALVGIWRLVERTPRSKTTSTSNATSFPAKPICRTAQSPWPNGASWRREIRIIRIFGDWFALD